MAESPEVLEGVERLREARMAGDGVTIWRRLLPTWVGSEDTGAHFSNDEWLEMFSLAKPRYKPYPYDSVTIYRGTIASHKCGLAWTTCFPLARWFAGRWIHEIEPETAFSYVYKTVAPAEAIVCVTDIQQHPHRQEHEIILNPAFLEQIGDPVDVVLQQEWPKNPLVVGCSCESHPPIKAGYDFRPGGRT